MKRHFSGSDVAPVHRTAPLSWRESTSLGITTVTTHCINARHHDLNRILSDLGTGIQVVRVIGKVTATTLMQGI